MGNDFVLEEAAIESIQTAFKNNILSAEELVLGYLERIARYDKKGPKINSVLEINPDAISQARALDYERLTSGYRSKLHGIPILVKDNIETADKLHTSGGSMALKDVYSKKDAYIIEKLRKAGAIILGKTNMTEWASYMSENMPAGYSSRGGQVLNPYGLNRLSPGGSSSGSAAAVTCNFCLAAIGTETSSSIVNPSGYMGIIGIKPTVGLVSRSGIIPATNMQDTAGPMTRTVEDAAILLGILAGYDSEDPITIQSQSHGYTDYTRFLEKDGLKGARIGVPREYFYSDLPAEESEIMDNALAVMKENGAEIIDNLKIPYAKELKSKRVNLYEFKSDLNYYLSKLDSHIPVHSLTELIHYNKEHSKVMLKYGQSFLEYAEKTSGSLAEEEYLKSRIRHMTLSRNTIDDTISEKRLDALVFPGDKGAVLVNKAGYPMVTVPAGIQKDGKGLGVTFAAGAFKEPVLIKLAYAFEQHAKRRVPPPIFR